jgi:hypothetical protein
MRDGRHWWLLLWLARFLAMAGGTITRVGGTFVKAQFREYTDSSFKVLLRRQAAYGTCMHRRQAVWIPWQRPLDAICSELPSGRKHAGRARRVGSATAVAASRQHARCEQNMTHVSNASRQHARYEQNMTHGPSARRAGAGREAACATLTPPAATAHSRDVSQALRQHQPRAQHLV